VYHFKFDLFDCSISELSVREEEWSDHGVDIDEERDPEGHDLQPVNLLILAGQVFTFSVKAWLQPVRAKHSVVQS